MRRGAREEGFVQIMVGEIMGDDEQRCRSVSIKPLNSFLRRGKPDPRGRGNPRGRGKPDPRGRGKPDPRVMGDGGRVSQ